MATAEGEMADEKEQETNPFDSPRPLWHKYPDMRII